MPNTISYNFSKISELFAEAAVRAFSAASLRAWTSEENVKVTRMKRKVMI